MIEVDPFRADPQLLMWCRAAAENRALRRERESLSQRLSELSERVRDVTRINEQLEKQNLHFRAALVRSSLLLSPHFLGLMACDAFRLHSNKSVQ
jgi:hypothetical protein